MPKTIREAEKQGLPVYIIRSNTVAQITNFLRQAFDKDRASGEEEDVYKRQPRDMNSLAG